MLDRTLGNGQFAVGVIGVDMKIAEQRAGFIAGELGAHGQAYHFGGGRNGADQAVVGCGQRGKFFRARNLVGRVTFRENRPTPTR